MSTLLLIFLSCIALPPLSGWAETDQWIQVIPGTNLNGTEPPPSFATKQECDKAREAQIIFLNEQIELFRNMPPEMNVDLQKALRQFQNSECTRPGSKN